ncbi:glycoside hydrolase family 2 protein [Acidicapsa acidisoli]|uniref:glycoside hydrolase family 2 protein n=1 Tax=Acidicapsa acidisoli TaxID=1615681 RepID=UPI0021E05AD7|nr:glycoside hydrolase family 2 TIM barrel-domain containing protein [Acidicapsa acidisoli]
MKLILLRFPAALVLSAMLVALSTACAVAESSPAAPIVLTGADRRPVQSLNGEWHVIPDPYQTGLYDFHKHEIARGWFVNQKAKPGDTGPVDYDFSKAETLKVPGDWNTQKPEFFWYEGLMWYEKDFNFEPKAHTRTFLRIGAANYKSIFWVNGQKVCEHEGGFTAFNCDVTAEVHPGSNFVIAVVDNTRHEDGVPTTQTDWFNYGGLTREVSLITVPEAFIDQYDLHLSRADHGKIEGWVHVNGGAVGETVDVAIPEANAKAEAKVGEDGRASIEISAPGLTLWSPETPKLYKVSVKAGTDSVEDLIGFRTVEVKGTEILLNGKPIFLRGVCIHAEAPYRLGRAYTDKDAETLLGWAKEMGANYVRLAHYPHDETMLRAADRMGLLVWSESPVYWAVQFGNSAVYANAQHQLEEEIGTSRNHAAIILWSMANETPINDLRTKFISSLAARARELDPTRLITAALLVHTEQNGARSIKVVDDPLGQYLDVLGTNEYIGWYEQHPETADTTDWKISYQKPLIMSEFGADAKAGLHGGENDRWTEEYQANVFRHQLGMLNRIDQLRGMSPWILMDFRSPRRPLAGIQDMFNRKGLISDQGVKKQAFFVLQKAYTEKTVGKAD